MTDIATDFHDLMRAFEAYKETNEQRLAELETRAADPLMDDKLARIDRALDDLQVKVQRPQLSTGVVTFLPGHLPPLGAPVSAGFQFDVPVRFDTDALEVNVSGFQAGAIPSIPLIEVRT